MDENRTAASGDVVGDARDRTRQRTAAPRDTASGSGAHAGDDGSRADRDPPGPAGRPGPAHCRDSRHFQALRPRRGSGSRCRVETTLVADVIAENDDFIVYEDVDATSPVSVGKRESDHRLLLRARQGDHRALLRRRQRRERRRQDRAPRRPRTSGRAGVRLVRGHDLPRDAMRRVERDGARPHERRARSTSTTIGTGRSRRWYTRSSTSARCTSGS